MAQTLQGKKIAILVENGFEQVELTEPRKTQTDALQRSEARTIEPTASARVRPLREVFRPDNPRPLFGP